MCTTDLLKKMVKLLRWTFYRCRSLRRRRRARKDLWQCSKEITTGYREMQRMDAVLMVGFLLLQCNRSIRWGWQVCMTKRHSRNVLWFLYCAQWGYFLFCMCFYSDSLLCCSVFILTVFYSIVGSLQEQKSPHSYLQVEHKTLLSWTQHLKYSAHPSIHFHTQSWSENL